MLMGELLTVQLHHLPVKTFVFTNSSLGMVKLEMLVQGLPEHETDPGAPEAQIALLTSRINTLTEHLKFTSTITTPVVVCC